MYSYMRRRMDDVESYVPPFQLDQAMDGGAIGVVVESNWDNRAVGDHVLHMLGWREYAVLDARDTAPVDAGAAPLSAYLGALGTTGLTAYAGLLHVAALTKGDVVFVSAPASGARVTAGEPCGEVESTKSVSDLYSPVDGEVTEVNAELEDDPSLVNAEPYTAGWMFRVRVAQDSSGDAALPTDLLSAAEYEELTKSAS